MAALFLAAAVLAIDLSLPLGVAGGVPYIAVVLLGWWAPKSRFIIALAVLSSVLTVFGYFLSPPGGIPWVVLTNRFLALFAIWITAALLVDAKKSTDKSRRIHVDLEVLFAEQTKELRESEGRFRDLAEGSLQGILIHDGEKPVFVNQAFADIFGYDGPEDPFSRKAPLEHVAAGDRERIREYTKARLAGEKAPDIYEFEGIRGDGSRIWVENRARAVTWKNGRAVQWIVVDITSRKQALESLQQAKEQAELANRTKTEFLAHMSHELRTPLNAILGYSDILKSQFFGPLGHDKYPEYANDIHQAGGHLLDVIGDILDISKVEAGELDIEEDEVDLEKIIGECRKLVQHKADYAKIMLHTLHANDLPLLRADARRLKQILLNLLSNAIKFTPEKGWVKINVEVNGTGAVIFRVSDNGIGIAPEDIPKVLRPFGQVREAYVANSGEGTGLGLSLVKALAELHEATLDIESVPGEGTMVTVAFPPERTIRDGLGAG